MIITEAFKTYSARWVALDEQTLRKVNMLRRWAHHIRNSSNNSENPSESIVARLRKSATNAEFLESLSKRT